MQLVFFWEHTFKNKGINFNSNFYFEVEFKEKKYHLKRIKEKESYLPKNFFGKNIENINCIIGKNGAGKTLLIKSILKEQGVFSIDDPLPMLYSLKKSLYIFEENNQFYIIKLTNKLIIDFEDYFLITTETKQSFQRLFDLKYVYYTTNLSTIPLTYTYNNISDISLRAQINNFLKKSKLSKNNFIVEYYQSIFQNILDFIINEEIIIENIPDKTFKTKLLNIKEKGRIFCTLKIDEKNQFIIKNKVFFDIFYAFKLKNETIDKYNKILTELWRYISYWAYTNIKNNQLSENILSEIIPRRPEENFRNWIISTINRLEKKINLNKKINNLNLFLKILKYVRIILINSKIKIDSDKIIFNYLDAKEVLEALFQLPPLEKYGNLFSIQFQEKFSSGEIEFLNFIISLKSCGNTIKEKNIIFFFEELEAFMHPEWQRKIIDFLPSLKDSLPWLRDKNIQIILTSHTPFIVGDLPEKNILFLEEGNTVEITSKTFGSNIYDLFKDNFLLESCFGEFSKKKIKKVIDLLSKDKEDNYNTEEVEKNITEIVFIIDSIGEPLIKNRLEKMYNEYKEFKNEKTIKTADFYTYLKENNLNLDEVLKILEERKNDKTI